MSYQQGQSPQWPQQPEQYPNRYPSNQGWGSPQQSQPWQQPNMQYPPPQQYPPQYTPFPQGPAPQWTQPTVPPQYYQQFQQPPPKKKSRAWLWVILGTVAVLVFACIGLGSLAPKVQDTNVSAPATTSSSSSVSNATSAPTQAPAQLAWQTTHTFKRGLLDDPGP